MCFGDACTENMASTGHSRDVPRKPDSRRSNKPIMEKRRRARINNCLNQLKSFLLDAMKKDPARHSKLEKADILELTVKYLQSLRSRQVAVRVANDPSLTSKYRAGFTECANEVGRYLGHIDNGDHSISQRLLGHLNGCLNNIGQEGSTSAGTQPPLIAPQPPLQLVPTRLESGDIAFVLPTQSLNNLFVKSNGSNNTASDVPDINVSLPFSNVSLNNPSPTLDCKSDSPASSTTSQCSPLSSPEIKPEVDAANIVGLPQGIPMSKSLPTIPVKGIRLPYSAVPVIKAEAVVPCSTVSSSVPSVIVFSSPAPLTTKGVTSFIKPVSNTSPQTTCKVPLAQIVNTSSFAPKPSVLPPNISFPSYTNAEAPHPVPVLSRNIEFSTTEVNSTKCVTDDIELSPHELEEEYVGLDLSMKDSTRNQTEYHAVPEPYKENMDTSEGMWRPW